MKLIRNLYVLISAIGIGWGYLVSQQSFFNRTTAEYTAWIDQSPVPALALVWLIGGLVLAFVPEAKSEEVEA